VTWVGLSRGQVKKNCSLIKFWRLRLTIYIFNSIIDDKAHRQIQDRTNVQLISNMLVEKEEFDYFKSSPRLELEFFDPCASLTARLLVKTFNPFTASCENAVSVSARHCEKFPHPSQLKFE
jgi:hypothetical protein